MIDESNPAVPTDCKGNCLYSVEIDSCFTCGRSMEEIRNAYSASNKARM